MPRQLSNLRRKVTIQCLRHLSNHIAELYNNFDGNNEESHIVKLYRDRNPEQNIRDSNFELFRDFEESVI